MKTYDFNIGGIDKVKILIGLYTVHDFMGQELPGLALLLVDADTAETEFDPEDGPNYDAVLSTSFGEYISIKDSFYVDTNNCPYAEEFLTRNNIAAKTNLTKSSGFCQYPLFVLTPEFVEELKADEGFSGLNYKLYANAVENYNPFGGFNNNEDDDDGN